MRKIPKTITEQELKSVLKLTRKKNHKLAFLLGFYQCMRISEVVNLKKEDIDMQRGFIYVKGSTPTHIGAKGGKDRDIPIRPEVKHYLRNLPIGIGCRALRGVIKRIAFKAINKDIHFHTLRHSGATYYLNEMDVDIRNIQKLLGHSKLGTTQIYTHVTPESLKKAFENADNRNIKHIPYSRRA